MNKIVIAVFTAIIGMASSAVFAADAMSKDGMAMQNKESKMEMKKDEMKNNGMKKTKAGKIYHGA
jgi:pentapeptide MXKDX repeat protein